MEFNDKTSLSFKKRACGEEYSQVFEVWEIFESFWVNVVQTFCISYLSERTDKPKTHLHIKINELKAQVMGRTVCGGHCEIVCTHIQEHTLS